MALPSPEKDTELIQAMSRDRFSRAKLLSLGRSRKEKPRRMEVPMC